MRTSIKAALIVAISALASTAVYAQSEQPAVATPAVEAAPATPAASPAPSATAAGPRIESASVAFQPAASAEIDVQRRGSSANLGQSRALMIAGAAGVVVGIIIGDDIGTLIAVSGAVVGLYGLYQYLK